MVLLGLTVMPSRACVSNLLHLYLVEPKSAGPDAGGELGSELGTVHPLDLRWHPVVPGQGNGHLSSSGMFLWRRQLALQVPGASVTGAFRTRLQIHTSHPALPMMHLPPCTSHDAPSTVHLP